MRWQFALTQVLTQGEQNVLSVTYCILKSYNFTDLAKKDDDKLRSGQ